MYSGRDLLVTHTFMVIDGHHLNQLGIEDALPRLGPKLGLSGLTTKRMKQMNVDPAVRAWQDSMFSPEN